MQSFVQVTVRGGSRARWRDHFKGGQREESLTDSERENSLHRAGSGAGWGEGVLSVNIKFIRGNTRRTGFWLNPLMELLLKAGQGDWALPRGGAWRVKPSLIC